MHASERIVIAFDLYGTLLSTSSIAKQLSSHFGDEKASELATIWRRCQLEYTWRCNSMKNHIPFDDITRRSLTHALTSLSLKLDASALSSILESYDSLSTFSDVSPLLETLPSHPEIMPVVFSNGTKSMVTNSVHHSPDLSPHAHVFKDIITVDEVKSYKPDPEVYFHLASKVGKDQTHSGKGGMGDIWLVSGNPFDIVGAKAMGLKTVWVARTEEGWEDCLVEGEEGKPDSIVKSLEEVVEKVKGYGPSV